LYYHTDEENVEVCVTALSGIIFRDRTHLSEVTRKNQNFITDKLFHVIHWLWLLEIQLLAYVGQSSNFQMHPPAVYANNTRVKNCPCLRCSQVVSIVTYLSCVP
jgi:hypothetical protein